MTHPSHGIQAGGYDDRPHMQTFEVASVTYRPHRRSDGRSDAVTMRVTYETRCRLRFSEWVCFEHPSGGYPRHRAEQWWALRSDLPCPSDSEAACEIAGSDWFPVPRSVTIHFPPSSRWPSVVGVELDPQAGLFLPLGVVARPSHDDPGRAA
jgi:hypothetical protein